MIFGILSCILLVSVDQLTKYLALQKLKPIGNIALINNIFDLTFVENRGAAFGIFQGGRWFFICLTSVMLLGLIIYYYKLTKSPKKYNFVLRVSLILIISGAIGNFADRLLNGFVIDFFHARFIDFPVFNMADIFVVSGSFLFAVLLFFFVKDDEHEPA